MLAQPPAAATAAPRPECAHPDPFPLDSLGSLMRRTDRLEAERARLLRLADGSRAYLARRDANAALGALYLDRLEARIRAIGDELTGIRVEALVRIRRWGEGR